MTATVAAAGTATLVNSNTIKLMGPVDAMMNLQYQSLVKNNDITLVQLESKGGRVIDGTKIADHILDNKQIKTEATGMCASMCAIIWLSAQDHVYNPEAKIGFHMAYLSNKVEIENFTYFNGVMGLTNLTRKLSLEDVMRWNKYMNNKEYLMEFITQVHKNGHKHDQMWFPTKDQLEKYEGQFQKQVMVQ